MYLVGTNVISEARRGTREAVFWLRSVRTSAIYLSVLTLGEIMKGVAIKERADRRAAGHLAEWLQKTTPRSCRSRSPRHRRHSDRMGAHRRPEAAG